MAEQIDCGCGLGDACPLGTTLAAAPTPVEHFCEYCGTTPCNCTDPNCSCRKDNPLPAAPAESQGVERAQPVEGPRELEDGCNPDPNSGRLKFERPRPAAPVEGVERVTDDAPARVEPEPDWKRYEFIDRKDCRCPCHSEMLPAKHIIPCCQERPDAQPAKHTDDRPREGDSAICGGCDRDISYGPQGWTHEDSDQRGCERAVPDDRPAKTIPETEETRVSITYTQWVEYRQAETRVEMLEAALREATIRCERINFTYEVPKQFRDNRTGTAYSSGYEAGWRDWCGENPYAYSQQRYFDAYEAGWGAAQNAVKSKAARAALAAPSGETK